MGSTKAKTTAQETATTTPQIPPYIQPSLTDYYGQVGQFGQTDPNDYTTPATGLQQQSFNAAAGLGGPNAGVDTALQQTQNLMEQGAALANAPSTLDVAQTGFQGYDIGDLGDPYFASAASAGGPAYATAAQTGDPYFASAAQLGPAQTYTPGAAPETYGYDVTQVGQFDPSQAREAESQSLLTGFDNYLNPATDYLVDQTLAGYDENAAQVRAQQQRQAALTGAFGGSRNAIAQAQTEAQLASGRAMQEAQLRYDAWNNAAGLSDADTARRQQAELFNADLYRQGMLQNLETAKFNAGNLNAQASQLADAQNRAALTQAGFIQDAGMAGTAAQNQFAMSNADYAQQVALANQGAANQFALTNADYAQQTGLANMGAANQFAQAEADRQQQIALANQGAANQYGLAQFGAQTDANQYAANAANQAAAQNAAAQNAAYQQQYGTQADMSRFNADQMQQQQALQAQLAQQYGQLSLADADQSMRELALQSDIGNTQWQLADQQTQALPSHLQTYGGLLNPSMINVVTPTQINSNSSSTTKTSGGLLNSLISAGATLGGAAMMSERRVKRDIHLIGREDDGLGVYTFRYKWDGENEAPRIGVMADEVADLRPWALGPVVDGVRTVNMGAL